MALRTARPTKRRRSSHHQFRKRVPADVLALAFGQHVTFHLPTGRSEGASIVVTIRPEISFSLRTPLAMLAKERHAAIVSQFERWCSAVRAGQPDQADAVSASSSDERSPLTFEALWIRWEREAKPAPSTVSTWWGYVLQFQRHLGHDDPRRVTPDDVVAWKDALLARGLTSVRDGHLAAVKTLFNYGVRNRLLKRSPAEGLTAVRKTPAGKRRLPYTDDEVAQLLALADRETRPSRRWLPWLTALSGARVGEVAQLWGNRITEIDGIPVMKIAPAADGGTLKNARSERDVLIHPAIIDRGFLDFVESKGGGPLFYRGTPRKQPVNGRPLKHPSKSVAGHLATWIREQGFRDPRKDPSHALRHWFKSKCLALGVQDSVVDVIQGHTLTGGAAATYRHISIAMMADAINRIPVPGESTNQSTERGEG